RKVCSNSSEDYHPDAAACQFLGIDPNEGESVTLKRGIPADCNFHTGYMGRTGVFEVLPVDSEIRDAIIQNKSSRELHKLAAERGMMSLEKAAKQKVLSGETTIEELHRVLVFAA
ncbi:MAG TPA: type II/IV secretion system protein, partial [Planctomycetaceae bacterium]|nr:type II/IV secretion system protein [Planctomycetaceae bacterium]